MRPPGMPVTPMRLKISWAVCIYKEYPVHVNCMYGVNKPRKARLNSLTKSERTQMLSETEQCCWKCLNDTVNTTTLTDEITVHAWMFFFFNCLSWQLHYDGCHYVLFHPHVISMVISLSGASYIKRNVRHKMQLLTSKFTSVKLTILTSYINS